MSETLTSGFLVRNFSTLLFAALVVAAPSLTGCGTQGSASFTSDPPPGADFTLTASPSMMTITAGVSGKSLSVVVAAENGFSGTVNVSLRGLPSGVTASPATLNLSPGIAQGLTLTAASGAAAGTSTITFTGTSGSLTHTATVQLTIAAITPPPDFSFAVSPISLALTAGTSGKSVSVTAAALNGFAGSVTVSLNTLPSGVTASPGALTLNPGVSQNLTFSAASNATVGTATITLTGRSGTLSHTATLALTVSGTSTPDFSLSLSPTSLILTADDSGQPVSLKATALNGFTGSISVSLSGLPSGVTASPLTLTLTPGTAQNVTLTAGSSAPAITATVSFTAKSGGLTHIATLHLTVNSAAQPGIDVTTYHYDNARDGLNAYETILTPAKVNSTGFGKVGFFGTDGKVDGAPLYLSSVTIGGVVHNVVYVVSEHDSVYAFDADTGTELWKTSVLGAHETPSDEHGCGQISPEIGITSTPVIDRHHGSHGAIFVVAMSRDSSINYHQRLHALDLTTGTELSGSPSEIQATYPGTGLYSDNGLQTFLPRQYAERVGLLLLNGVIYMGWTSHCDEAPYTGWLMGYSETTLKQASVLNLTANTGGSGFGAGEGSIWMSGAGLAADAVGNIYFLDANGGFDTTLVNGFPIHGDFGNAFMKVSTAGGKLSVADYFNPFNTVTESDGDQDLGSGGVLLLPDLTDSNGQVHQLAVGAGKDHAIYVVDRNNMGKFNSSHNNIYQELGGATANGVWGMAAWFNGTIYYGGQSDVLKAFSVVNARLQTTPSSQSSQFYAYPGATPSVSANGTRDGIVWAVENGTSGRGILHAYNATNLGHELYNSTQASDNRDYFVDNKFITPVVANGKVFVGTPTGVVVFGLLSK